MEAHASILSCRKHATQHLRRKSIPLAVIAIFQPPHAMRKTPFWLNASETWASYVAIYPMCRFPSVSLNIGLVELLFYYTFRHKTVKTGAVKSIQTHLLISDSYFKVQPLVTQLFTCIHAACLISIEKALGIEWDALEQPHMSPGYKTQ